MFTACIIAIINNYCLIYIILLGTRFQSCMMLQITLYLMKKLVLIDGNHLMHRAYWAIPRTLKTKGGVQINAVFGFASMLINILAKEDPTGVLFCFDAGSETFRHQENPTYKDGRATTPDDFYEQIPLISQLIQVCKIAQVSDPNLEADDLIASYAVEYASKGTEVIVVSGDKDLYQLASKNITIAIPHKGYQAAQYLDANGVQEALGVTPAQVPCYKGLCGDSSDNLPGVRGIGPKTAVNLITTYGTLESIYEHIAEIKGTVQTKLLEDKEQAFFCERQATLVTDAPTYMDAEMLALNMPLNEVEDFFIENEFTMLLRRLPILDKDDKFNLQSIAKLSQKNRKNEENSSEDQLALF